MSFGMKWEVLRVFVPSGVSLGLALSRLKIVVGSPHEAYEEGEGSGELLKGVLYQYHSLAIEDEECFLIASRVADLEEDRIESTSMGKKRKADATRLDEVDRTIYSSFCSAANSLSLIYTQAMAQQKLAFQSGERHALEKLYQLILRHNQEGSRVTVADIVAYLQNEMACDGEDASISPSPQLLQYPHSTTQISNPNSQNSDMVATATVGQAPRFSSCDQGKNTVFSNALSSPVRRSLEPYHIAQGGANHNNIRDHESNHLNQNQGTHFQTSSDTSMDMHSDSPARGPY
ncbi:hypothetical protein Cni_G16893 [Canna indica]|uniref:Uncharacterized protein n=1 Tax=Canna indica TaxID=4628 RepID=A0AAQ3KLR1_9LILI|nr:hypothetical protein Cni_G16893 [Canna indica]